MEKSTLCPAVTEGPPVRKTSLGSQAAQSGGAPAWRGRGGLSRRGRGLGSEAGQVREPDGFFPPWRPGSVAAQEGTAGSCAEWGHPVDWGWHRFQDL